MKKILLPLVAVLLSATAATAQVQDFGHSLKAQVGMKTMHTSSLQQVQKKAEAPAKKDWSPVSDEQRYIGNTNSANPYYFIGLPGAKTYEVGTALTADFLQKYVGDKVIGVRFALGQPIGKTTVHMRTSNGVDETTGEWQVGSDLASADLASTQAVNQQELVWNEVKFDVPYTIPQNPSELLFSFDYDQKATVNSDGTGYADECYALLSSSTGTINGYIVKADLTLQDGSKLTTWVPCPLDNHYVNLCMQVLVERKGGYIEDIELGSISANKFVWKDGGSFNVAFSCTNSGSNTIKDYTFGVAIDGNEFATMAPGTELNNTWSVFNVNGTKVPADVNVGTHVLSLYVKDMNGGKPTGDLSNDTLRTVLRVYNDCMAHQKNLVEHFTSQGCSACPYGYDVLNALNKKRNDIAWVAVHNYYSTKGDDEFVCDGSEYITSYSISGFPQANFNRFLFSNEDLNPNYNLALGIGYQNASDAANTFSQIIDYGNNLNPSFVNLNITSNYDSDNDGELTLTVTGKGVKDAAKILQATRLTIYLTEDGNIGTQQYGSSTLKKYAHDHVLRMIVTSPGGDDIEWNGDNFEMTYTVNIPEDYDYTQMHAIAFINNRFVEFSPTSGNLLGWYQDQEDAWVSNCNMVDIADGETTGVKTVVAGEAKTVVARYAADGTQLSAPVKGINIVKYSDGTTQTVLVK